MCLFNESKLYVENTQKEHNRAFFVCTLWMWASIPALDFLGAMSQLPHLYSTVCTPKLTWIGFSTIVFSSVLTPPTSIGSCSCSSLTGVAVGVGVVWVLTYWRSWGSSPTPTSEYILSNAAHPWATSWCPLATVQIAANYKNICILISSTCVPFTVWIAANYKNRCILISSTSSTCVPFTVWIAANYKNRCILISSTSLTCVPFTVFISF